MNRPEHHRNEQGAALVIALIFLAILALLGSTAVILSTTDIQIASNYKGTVQSFADAGAGVGYGIGKMQAGLKAGTFSLPANVGDTTAETLTTYFSTPTAFSFSLSEVTKIADNAWTFTIDGTDPNSSTAETMLQVTFKREPAIQFAAFGDKKLDTKNGGTTLSYKSNSSDPTANDPGDPSFQTTHEADVGSNDWLVTHNGASIDGSGVFGEQEDGSPTTDGIHGGTSFYGPTPTDAGRIDPDPLDVNGGGEYDPTTYVASNDNALATGLVGNTINGGPVTLVGKDPCANYYLTSITLRNGDTLTVNAAAGDVRVFLTGGLDARNGSSIVLTPNPLDTTCFAIFSNSTTKIDFKHSSTLAGLIYAPYAPIDVKNSADFYGAIWGSNVDIKNSGTVYFDSALKDAYASNNLTMIAWQDIRR